MLSTLWHKIIAIYLSKKITNNINIIDFCPNIENKEYSLNPTPDILLPDTKFYIKYMFKFCT